MQVKTREKIISTAKYLFVQQGIHKTSTNQICKEVGIASGTLFVHFKTKQDLIDQIYLERKKVFLQAVPFPTQNEPSIKDYFLKTSVQTIEYFLQNYSDFLYFQLLENGPTVSQKARDLYMQEISQSISIVSNWQKDGVIKNIKTPLLIDLWWSMLIAFIRHLHKRKNESVKEADIQIVWEALKAEKK